MRIRVVVAEDDLLVREGITTLLATQGDLEIVAVSSDLDGLLEVVASERPDVVVTDIRMPPGHSDEGIRAARLIRKKYPQVGVVVLSQFDDPGYVLAVLEDGTDRRGYLLKERISDVDELAGAIRIVAAGGSVIDPKVVEALVTRQHRKSGSRLQWLTARELEVVAAMAEGQDNEAIAESLYISVRAVEKHINSIFAKLGIASELGVHKRVRAVLLFLGEG